MLFYDSMTGKTFESNRDKIIDAVSKFNRKLYEELQYKNSGRFIGEYDLLISEELLTKELLNETFNYNSSKLGVMIEVEWTPQLDVEFYYDVINGDPVVRPKYSIEIFV